MLGTLVHVNQRRAVRRSLRVDCHVLRERDGRLLAERGVDLSPEGMRVLTADRVLTGEPVIIAFRLPQSWHWVESQGEVARVVHGRRPGDGGRSLGLAFGPLSSELERYLRAALRGVPPPLPTREPRIDYAATVHLAVLS